MGLSDRLRKAQEHTSKPAWLNPSVLLQGNIPKPMHGLAPRTILGQKWWDRERKLAYKASEFHCVACGVHKTNARYHKWLEGHEQYRIDYLIGRMEYIGAVSLCHFCHNGIHDGRLRMLLERGEIHHAKYAAIIQHRDKVLFDAGLVRPEPYSGPVAAWEDWRMVLDGKEYPSLWRSFEHWEQAHR
jgi:hypothetical protein